MTNKSVWWIRSAAMLIGLQALTVSCTGVHKSNFPELENKRPSSFSAQYGMASWYGRELQGRQTASGEPFQMSALTAAHPQAPLGSYAQVTNLANGESVQVRINDRGPFKSSRIIDLSYEAARRIGLIQTGTGRVKVEFLEEPRSIAVPATLVATSKPSTAAPSPLSLTAHREDKHAGFFTVQAGAYREQTNALRAQRVLAPLHSYVALNRQPSTAGSLYRVYLGRFTSRDEAELLARQVKKQGYAAAVIVLPSEQFSRACTATNPC